MALDPTALTTSTPDTATPPPDATPVAPSFDPSRILADVGAVLGPQLATQIVSEVQGGVTDLLVQHKASVVTEVGAQVTEALVSHRTEIEARLAEHSAQIAADLKSVANGAHLQRARILAVLAIVAATVLGVLGFLAAAVSGNHFAESNIGTALEIAGGVVLWVAKSGLAD